MLKSHHTFFLKNLDSVLDKLNSPYKNYTLTYQELFKLVSPGINYDRIYQDSLDNWLGGKFDDSIESENKTYLLNASLHHLVNNEYVFNYKSNEGENSFQITQKGFLKIHLGFVKTFENEKLKLENLKSQTAFDNVMKVLGVLVPSVLSFLFGLYLR